ncbi:DUF1102 domain-containing protein [Halogeometricum sp. CBA1124]|uniref:DUF1102 domain-containing protein n=1 Tax=Halogeometricum sp. CBA1124 TaxID=2668071 RepID=UPI00142C39C8|nr:DUF1102 domain-containing protein [Halogeometricum sp. CBA1124]MUV58424.1 DUF1102 domain-containing protein [Halogeometricum sp. CBA1124]
MQRRTFIGGLGVLAAAGSAVFGTAAVSNVTAERNITASVAGDGSAYLEIREGAANGFAVENLDGAFRLNFANDPDGGNGLNEDAVSSFDDAFRINNTGDETLAVHIEDAKDRIEFYFGEDASDGDYGNDTTVTTTLEPGDDPLMVGVRIDLRDVAAAGVFAGDDDFTIVAEDVDDNA